jgi:low affinity Fe/Cu permease
MKLDERPGAARTLARPGPMTSFFHKLAAHASRLVGSAYAFLGAVALIVVWLATGPAFDYSDTWQLIINTSTTIVTFLMVFLIQNTQNRDSLALHLKLDELIRATQGARNSMIDLAKLSDDQLHELELEFERICTEGGERTCTQGEEIARTRQQRRRRDRAERPDRAERLAADQGAESSRSPSDRGSCPAR